MYERSKLATSLLVGWESIVHRAQVEPGLFDDLGLVASSAVLGSFSEDDGETSFKMPVNVAREKKRSADEINELLERD